MMRGFPLRCDLLSGGGMYALVPALMPLLITLLNACGPSTQASKTNDLKTPPVKMVRMQPGQWAPKITMASNFVGSTWWLAGNGHLAVVYLFEDSNGDGKVLPKHTVSGRFLTDQPVPYLFDLQKRSIERFERFVATGPNRRYIALATGTTVWIIDAETKTRWNTSTWPVTRDDDENPCLRSRRIHLDRNHRAWFIHRNERDLGYVDLKTNTQHIVRNTIGRPWRMYGLGSPHYLLADVVSSPATKMLIDLPKSTPKCACMVCQRFETAEKQKTSWVMPKKQTLLVTPRSVRAVPPNVKPWTANAIVDAADTAHYMDLSSKKMTRRPLPKACRVADVSTDGHVGLIRCGRWFHRYNTKTHQRIKDTRELLYVPPQRARLKQGMSLVAVVARDKRKRYSTRLGVLDLNSGALHDGPMLPSTSPFVTLTPSGWFVGVANQLMRAIHLDTTQQRQWTRPGLKRFVANSATVSTAPAFFGAFNAALIAPYSDTQSQVTTQDCVFAPASRQGAFEFGPWSISCLRAQTSTK